MTVVFDALETLEGKRDGCLLGEPTCRRPVLPGPALPRGLAVRRRTPTRLWYVQVLDSTKKQPAKKTKLTIICQQLGKSRMAD